MIYLYLEQMYTISLLDLRFVGLPVVILSYSATIDGNCKAQSIFFDQDFHQPRPISMKPSTVIEVKWLV